MCLVCLNSARVQLLMSSWISVRASLVMVFANSVTNMDIIVGIAHYGLVVSEGASETKNFAFQRLRSIEF